MVRLTIDGKEIEVPEGTNIIEAARRLGIEVPHYCYHPGLSPRPCSAAFSHPATPKPNPSRDHFRISISNSPRNFSM